MIEAYYKEGIKVTDIMIALGRSKQTVYHVINFLKDGHSAYDYYEHYKANKKRCGRRKQAFRRDLRERAELYSDFHTEFGHLEGDTIVGEKHKSASITLVERRSKAIITMKTKGRKASDIEEVINQWLSRVPSHLFKSITFDCGKEFSNWKSISNAHDIDIFVADPGWSRSTRSQ